MMVRIRLLQPFRARVGKDMVQVDVQGTSVEDALRALCEAYPLLRPSIFSDEGTVSGEVCVILNETPLTGETPYAGIRVSPSDEILLFLPISGGCGPFPSTSRRSFL